MNRLWLGLAMVATAGIGSAQATMVYNPTKTISEQGITLSPWGSGSVAQTDEAAFQGRNSIRISTRNYFMGGRLVFATPVDLSKSFDDDANLLEVSYQVPNDKGAGGGGPGGFKGGPPSGGGRPGAAGGGGGLSGGEGGGGQTKGGPGGGSASTAFLTTLDTIRMIVTTSDGKMSEVFVPCNKGGIVQGNWRSVAIPLKAINGFERTNKMVSGLSFSGDATTTFYIGEVKMMHDTTPIYGQPSKRDYNLYLGQEIDLSATGSGGTSVLRYTWDFDSADGIQSEAEGQFIRRKFRKPGEYVVTLTISDYYNLKKPYTTTIKIKVNP